jgi:hypothetical protein
MKSDRRRFLKVAGLAGTGIIAGEMTSLNKETLSPEGTEKALKKVHKQLFNMSGYSAPKLEKVRIGLVGLGHRGPSSLRRLTLIEGVEINALCDFYPDRVEIGRAHV